MKTFFPAIVFLFSVQISAQPYVFYRGDKIIVQTLDFPAMHIDSFPAMQKTNHSVNIHFADNPSWDFAVRLKQVALSPSVTKRTRRILFLSDIEGEFALFRQLLIANKIIDEHYNWIFGRNSLVICGDLFDRGSLVTEELWLLYRIFIVTLILSIVSILIPPNSSIINSSVLYLKQYGFVVSYIIFFKF